MPQPRHRVHSDHARNACCCTERLRYRDFAEYSMEIADWAPTPEDLAWAVGTGYEWESVLSTALDECYGLRQIEYPFGLEQ